jgi:aspartyl/asparaginyl beta-hydroxylase (cupin superfamily)
MIKDNTVPGITRIMCPNTIKILESIKGINIAGFSLANKDCVIPPHTDATGPSFGTLAYHLCLTGESTLVVNNQKIIQSPSKVIIFNPEYEHYLYNHTDNDRIILYIDFKMEV